MLWVTSRSIKNWTFHKAVARKASTWTKRKAKLPRKKSHRFRATSTVGQTSISRWKATANPGSFRRDQLPTCLPTGAEHSALPKRHTDLWPGSGRPAWTNTNRKAKFFIFSEWPPWPRENQRGNACGHHCAQAVKGPTSAFLQQGINHRNRCISPLTLHCKCSQTERTHTASSKPQPGIRNLPSHTVPQPFPRTLITRKSHRGQ